MVTGVSGQIGVLWMAALVSSAECVSAIHRCHNMEALNVLDLKLKRNRLISVSRTLSSQMIRAVMAATQLLFLKLLMEYGDNGDHGRSPQVWQILKSSPEREHAIALLQPMEANLALDRQ